MKSLYISRRNFIKKTASAAVATSVFPYINACKNNVTQPMTRSFGKLNFDVTTLGLGGQASIQWTPDDVDPVQIILKAFKMGLNYFDTSNLYGPSQNNFGKAFHQLDLIPGQSGYDETLRESVWLTSKTHIRVAKGNLDIEGINNWTNGSQGSHTVDDVKRSLSQIFGDGHGNYPKGSYLNMVLLHSITSLKDLEIVFEGYENTDPKAERIGALAALRDVRDGTNLTGLNPKEEKLIRHVGFSGHYSAPVMMELIRRDTDNVLEGMLVAINANDKLNLNMQHNVIPVASAKNMGIIAMKVFADGAMYTKDATWSNVPDHVVRTVGSNKIPSRPLVHYSLTTPGIHTAIIGIGQIDDKHPANCQLEQNLSAAQIRPDGLTETQREDVEKMARAAKEGKTNYFQIDEGGLSPVQSISFTQSNKDQRSVELNWSTAIAGDAPIERYEVWRDRKKIGEVKHQPQTTPEPFKFYDNPGDLAGHLYQIYTVDAKGQKAETEGITVNAV